jgi:hypothetical protein
VRYAPPPEHAPLAGSFGGGFDLRVSAAGRFQVALDGPAWVDMVRDGRALPSATHGHGPDCTGIRKLVGYDLTPGTYRLQLSGRRSPAVRVLGARKD